MNSKIPSRTLTDVLIETLETSQTPKQQQSVIDKTIKNAYLSIEIAYRKGYEQRDREAQSEMTEFVRATDVKEGGQDD